MKNYFKFLVSIISFFTLVAIQCKVVQCTPIDPNNLCSPCEGCTTTFEFPTNPPFAKEIDGIYQYCPIISGAVYNGTHYYFEIFYKVRECYCPELIREIYIDHIKFLVIPPASCSNLPKDLVVNKAVQQMLYESWSIFNIGQFDVNFNVSIMLPKCWACKFIHIPHVPPAPRIPDVWEIYPDDCTPVTCCKTNYTMKMTGSTAVPPNQVVVVSKTPIAPPNSNECSGGGPSNQGKECTDICSDNNIPTGPLFNGFESQYCTNDPCYDPWIRTTEDDNVPKVFTLEDKNYQQPSGWDYFFNVWFETRRTCYVDYYLRHEIRVYKIDILENDIGKTDDEILELAYRRLLRKAGDIFGWSSDGNNDTVNVTLRIPECWIRVDDKLLIPCDNNACCLAEYNIRREPQQYGGYKYSVLYAWNIASESSNCNSQTTGCNNMCTAINFAWPEEVYKISTGEKTDNIRNENRCYVVPNPTSKSTNIYFENELKGKLELKIYNSIGEVIHTQTLFKNNFISFFEIDASRLNNGVYFFKLILNNEQIEKGSFIVDK